MFIEQTKPVARRYLLWVLAIQAALFLSTAVFFVFFELNVERKGAAAEAQAVSAFAEQSMLASEVFLRNVASEVRDRPDLFQRFDGAWIDRWSVRAQILPQVRSVSLISADGILINDAVVRGERIIDLSDRPYFTRLQDGDRRVIVTEPTFSPARDSWFFGMVLGVFADEGRMLGSVILEIEPIYFLERFARLTAAGYNVGIISDTNTLVTARLIDFGVAPLGKTITLLPPPGVTQYMGTEILGPGIISHFPVPTYPLGVLIHRPVTETLSIVLGPLIGALIIAAVGTTAVSLVLGRLRASEIKLAAEHEMLLSSHRQLADTIEELGESNLALSETNDELERARARLEEMIATDALTAATSRRAFLEQAAEEFARAARYDRDMCVVVLDIDHFKKINDTHGHAAGDEALKLFAQTCMHAKREQDVFGRLGGEEFALLLPETDAAAAHVVAERVRLAIAGAVVTHPERGTAFTMTVSQGIAARARDDRDVDALLGRADVALYAAKNNGRNRVEQAAA